MKKRYSIGVICSSVLTAVLAVSLLCSVYSIAVRQVTGKQYAPVFGYSVAVVISGSMSGSIEIDDMVIIHRQESYSAGDVITFESGANLVTHRILDVTEDGFVTKGDANNAPDLAPVPQELVVGKVVQVIPGVGRFIQFARTPLGMMLIVLIGYALVVIPSAWERRQEEKKGGAQYEKTE